MSTLRIMALSAVFVPVFCSTPAVAGDDPKHPAYDFMPTIIQSASPASGGASSAASSAQTPAEDSKYPATYFTPKVIYLDPSLAK
ncbi:MAG: hypothetical protein EPN21_15165 [Methylococcaceae bacterium]|nr:MAG: hypothetical protein EPN21_15165 [Methylococcaceae bacterium]